MTAARLAVLPALTVAVVLAGCGGGQATATATSAAATTSAVPARSSAAAPTSAVPSDPHGQAVCDKLKAVMGTDGLYQPDTLEPIGQEATQSTDMSIRIKGQLIVDYAGLARAAKGGDDELSTTLTMGTSATELATYCIQHGYTKP